MTKLLLAAAAVAALSTPAHAGFFLEGLQPFAGDYCRDADLALSDPVVQAPGIDWETQSATGKSLGGRVPYVAHNCKSGKAAGAASYPARIHRKPAPAGVPQK